jgi:hypothetical protein
MTHANGIVLGLGLLVGCQPSASSPRSTPGREVGRSRPLASPRSIALLCPPAQRTGSGHSPWETYRHSKCIRGPEGRWRAERDPTDRDGWRHVLVFDGTDGRRWRVPVTAPTGLARRLDGHVLVLDLKQVATLISPAGVVVWRSAFPRCGALDSVAIGWDDVITFACGYTLVRIEKDGKVAWQKWPFGNQHVHNVWVACDGTLHVTSGGQVAALHADGTRRWTLSTGFNRYVQATAWLPNGHLVLQTSMSELHTPTSPGGFRFYHEYEPPELIEVTPDGRIARREVMPSSQPAAGWPTTLPLPEDGAYRMPLPGCAPRVRPLH